MRTGGSCSTNVPDDKESMSNALLELSRHEVNAHDRTRSFVR